MGTETTSNFLGSTASGFSAVKLNNPLMGTETILCSAEFSYALTPKVKLNNPLMGTETTICDIC